MSKQHVRSPHNPERTPMRRESALIGEMIDTAWEKFSIQTINAKLVRVYWETNDDRDWGMPTEYSSDVRIFTGEDALKKAKDSCGVSRQGVGHLVLVTLDGKKI